MSRKKQLGIMLVLVCVIIVVSSAGYNNLGERTVDQPQHNPPELPEGPLFTVPETPLGVLGAILACAIAFGVIARATKKRVRVR